MNYLRYFLIILGFSCLVTHAYSQDNYLEIINYKGIDTSMVWDCSSFSKPILSEMIKNKFVLSVFFRNNNLDSIFHRTRYSFFSELILNPKIKSLLFLEIAEPDTMECIEDIRVYMTILNFDLSCNLISSSKIARFESINNGFSYSGKDTELIFRKNRIIINEIIDNHPTDMVLKFKIKPSTFKESKKYKIKMEDNGLLYQIN